jgi:hypothetical protein
MFGLWLGINAVRWQRVHEVFQALRMANSSGDLPADYYRAISASEKEAEDLRLKENSQRQNARARQNEARGRSY